MAAYEGNSSGVKGVVYLKLEVIQTTSVFLIAPIPFHFHFMEKSSVNILQNIFCVPRKKII